MNPTLALACCTVLVVALLVVERRGNRAVSGAVWVPTIWTLVSGSKPFGSWFGQSGLPSETVEAGSPVDRFVLGLLIAVAVAVILRRKTPWYKVAQNNRWLLLLYLYMAVSISWSEFPIVSFKRWVRTFGPVVMALVVAGERNPLKAFEAIFRRAAYVLIPFSLVLVKYFPMWGVEFDRWDGRRMWIGVATQKNGLGQICAMSVLLLLWMALSSWRSGESARPRFQRSADLMIVAIALFLLRGPPESQSATAIAILATGSASLLLLARYKGLRESVIGRLQMVTVVLVLTSWIAGHWLLGPVTAALGRDPTLTGRSEIWEVLLDISARSPLLGVGYGGFWGLHPEITSRLNVGQSHNGYIGVYLELGMLGIVLLGAFILAFCGIVRKALDKEPDLAVFGVCVLAVTLLYNVSESAFLTERFLWTTMVITAVLTSSYNGVCPGNGTRERARPAFRAKKPRFPLRDLASGTPGVAGHPRRKATSARDDI